jgi:NADPH2:quinone reductase
VRAIVVREAGGPSALRLEELPTPAPGPDEVTIDVAYAGTGFVDTLFRSGALPAPLPFVPGIEVTGTVREIGEGVPDLAPGDTVGAMLNDFGRGWRAGGYAAVAVAHRTMTVPLPSGADLARVTAVLINGVTAWLALRDLARTASTDSVVIFGASGGLGGTTCRLAALLPSRRVVGVVSRDVSRAPAACTDVVLSSEFDGWIADPANAPDVVIDPVGGGLRATAFGHLAPFGRQVILGNASGDDPPLSGDGAWHGSRTLSGLSLGATAHLVVPQVQAALYGLVDLMARGALDEPRPAVVPLGEAAAVHQAFADRTAPPKTVLDVSA